MNTQYNGWKNYNTWNVALWLGNDYPLYQVSMGYAKHATPFLSLRQDLRVSFGFTETRDGVSLWSRDLDIEAINDAIIERVINFTADSVRHQSL